MGLIESLGLKAPRHIAHAAPAGADVRPADDADAQPADDAAALSAQIKRQLGIAAVRAQRAVDAGVKARLAKALKAADTERLRAERMSDPAARAAALKALLRKLGEAAAEPAASQAADAAETSSEPAPPLGADADEPQPAPELPAAGVPVSAGDSPPPPAAALSPKDAKRVRDWLEEHQFAPPAERGSISGEPRVLLNGQETTRAQAASLAAKELSLPVKEIAGVIDELLAAAPTMLQGTPNGGPIVGKGNTVPGIPLTDLSIKPDGRVSPAVGKSLELETVDKWLKEHRFEKLNSPSATGADCMLDGQVTTVDKVADRAFAALGGGGNIKITYVSRQDVLNHLRQSYVKAPAHTGTQISLQYTLVPQAVQASAAPPDPRNPARTQHQFQFTIARLYHASDAPGPEGALQGSVTLDSQGRIVNLAAGAQAQIVAPLLNGWLQIAGVVQAMVSANWSNTVTGTTVSPAVQVSMGGQVAITPQWPTAVIGGSFKIGAPQLSVQAMGNAQASKDGLQPSVTGGINVTVPFDLSPIAKPPQKPKDK